MNHRLIVCLLISLVASTTWGQTVSMVPQTGHASQGIKGTIARDGSFMLSGDANRQVKLWDLHSLRQVRMGLCI